MRDERRIWKGTECLVYKRCSKETQDVSLDDQEQGINLAMANLGLKTALATLEDDGKRGQDESRPGLLAVLAYVRTHPNPVRNNSDFIPILVYDLSRFGRFDDPKKVFSYFVEVERYGFEFYSVSERIRSRGNIGDWVQAIIKSEQAYDYSVSLSRYAMRTACSLAQKGWWPGGQAPLGYDRMTFGPDGKPKYRYATLPDKSVEKRLPNGEIVEVLPPLEDRGRFRSAYSDKLKTDKVKLVPGRREQVKMVQLIFKKFVEDGWGLRRVSSYLNGMGMLPPRGGVWLHTAVRSVITNPAYKGTLVYGRRSDGKHHWLTIGKNGDGYTTLIERKDVPGPSFVHRTEDECIVIDNCHEALVEQSLWDRAQRRLTAAKHGPLDRIRGLGVRSSYLLSGDGLMRCSHCGYRFQGDTDRRSKIRRYIDSGYHMGGKSVCSCYMVPAEPLEGWIVDQIQDRILDGRARLFASRKELEEAIEKALGAGRSGRDIKNDEVARLERTLAERKEKVSVLVANVSAENMALLNDHLSKLRQEIAGIEAELRALRVAYRAGDIITRDLKALAHDAAGYIVNLRKVLEEGSAEEKKRFVRDFVGDVLVNGKEREVRVGFYENESKELPLKALEISARRAAGDDARSLVQSPLGGPPLRQNFRTPRRTRSGPSARDRPLRSTPRNPG